MLEDALEALSAADAPPERDRAFEIAVLARMERRRFQRTLMRNAALTLAATLVLALAMPGLESAWRGVLAAGLSVLPPGLPVHLTLGTVLATACLALLPWWRRAF